MLLETSNDAVPAASVADWHLVVIFTGLSSAFPRNLGRIRTARLALPFDFVSAETTTRADLAAYSS